MPLKDFNNTNDTNKIVIGLRHDIDVDLNGAMIMAKIEKKYEIPIMIDYSKWKKGDKIIILTHPTHWY